MWKEDLWPYVNDFDRQGCRPVPPRCHQGPTGPSGAIGNYGYIYHAAIEETSLILAGGDVDFSNNGPLGGVTHTTGKAAIVVLDSGIYQIDYSITIVAGIGAAVAIAVNGTVDLSTNVGILVGSGTISGTAMIALGTGDLITLRNNSDVSFTLALSPYIGAQINLIRIS